MKSARQVLRWGIPGWLLIVFLLIFFATRSVFDRSIPILYDHVTKSPSTLVAVGLSIPSGFLIFQLYWRIHWWNFPFNVVHRDKGYLVLKDANIDFEFVVGTSLDATSTRAEHRPFLFPFLVLGFLEDEPPEPPTIIERYQQNWYLADFAWYDTIRRHKLEFLEQRATFLGDTYHSLGAARISLLLAIGFYFLHDLIMIIWRFLDFLDGWAYLRVYWLPLVINLFAIVPVIFFMLSFSREDTLEDLIALKHHVITHLSELPKMQGEAPKVGSGIPG